MRVLIATFISIRGQTETSDTYLLAAPCLRTSSVRLASSAASASRPGPVIRTQVLGRRPS
jgi:hypothetical protein